MKKRTLFISGITLILIAVIVVLIPSATYSGSKLPFENDDSLGQDKMCENAIKNGFTSLNRGWNNYLATLGEQQKPASEMVDEAIESFRTYRCWTEYFCQSVGFSAYGNVRGTRGSFDPFGAWDFVIDPSNTGHVTIQNAVDEGLTQIHIGQVPGCQAPEDLSLPPEWSDFVKYVEDYWKILYANNSSDDELIQKLMALPTEDKFVFIPQCMMKPPDNNNISSVSDSLTKYYEMCRGYAKKGIPCTDQSIEGGAQNCLNKSSMFLQLKTALQSAHEDQKNRIFQDKMTVILSKMMSMEMHAQYLKEKFFKLDKLFPCYISDCT